MLLEGFLADDSEDGVIRRGLGDLRGQMKDCVMGWRGRYDGEDNRARN